MTGNREGAREGARERALSWLDGEIDELDARQRELAREHREMARRIDELRRGGGNPVGNPGGIRAVLRAKRRKRGGLR